MKENINFRSYDVYKKRPQTRINYQFTEIKWDIHVEANVRLLLLLFFRLLFSGWWTYVILGLKST